MIHGKLPWQGAFAPENKTLEAAGNDPTSGDPDRIIKEAFKEGFPKRRPENSTSAANFMVEMVHKYPGQVTIYSAGALTNVALAVRMDPQFASLAKDLVIMGGYVDLNMLQATGSVTQANHQSDVSILSIIP
jgi:inosine-uridine nucleoside N-ribohydrolase